ncbi:hypothetical protein SLEP1_g41592 [Rubroshorea leprosula]|uniref:Uncharacterized protein n=1 Tax=Rubroshorea leprosula TaxID=152421 RepID=A0AAV5L806_9ROSI|nr:hypothetical protein SLEP1_g41592 [Rubroshorea leprosula]
MKIYWSHNQGFKFKKKRHVWIKIWRSNQVILNLVAEEMRGELPSATMKNQEEKVNTLPLEIEGQLEEVESIPTKTKQEDVPKEEEEQAQVSFEVFNGESPLTKSDFNDHFVINMVDKIL